MTKFKFMICCITSSLFLFSCSEILEPVTLFVNTPTLAEKNTQEDFKINVKALTFESARNANNTSYPRQVMESGIGSKANVFDEADFLNSKIPTFSPAEDYILGIGDQLIYSNMSGYSFLNSKFPTQLEKRDYLLGVGDQLTLYQLNNMEVTRAANINNITDFDKDILETRGFVGTDGNILLLGLGSFKAKDRSLNDIQTVVRNILIRNGISANFQLEITGFNSKKALLTSPYGNDGINSTIPITHLQTTLKELVVKHRVKSSSNYNIKLNRNGQIYNISIDKLFNESSPDVFIQDGDHITIFESKDLPTFHNLVVGTKGNILLPQIGKIKAENRSLVEIQSDINQFLLDSGQIPNYQIAITNFNSKSFFLVGENFKSKKIPLTSSKLRLKEAVLSANLIHPKSSLTIIELIRNNVSYQITLHDLLFGNSQKVYIQNGDTIKIKDLQYKLGAVFALSGAGKAQMVPIDPSKRETLADILFTAEGALNNLRAKRSEVYLLRGKNPSVAYHLDAQNVSRVLVAAKTELRPNDIIYVAERPIISFSRTLSEILPLRILLRDIQNDRIP
jgi:protein involved in polysaccharide export with SLBB domain